MKKLFRFTFFCGRQGSLHGLFVADDADVARAMGTTIDFDEPFGKHSFLNYTISMEHFEIVTDDQDFIAKWEQYEVGSCGEDPIGTAMDMLNNPSAYGLGEEG